jgi:hypothetical protein
LNYYKKMETRYHRCGQGQLFPDVCLQDTVYNFHSYCSNFHFLQRACQNIAVFYPAPTSLSTLQPWQNLFEHTVPIYVVINPSQVKGEKWSYTQTTQKHGLKSWFFVRFAGGRKHFISYYTYPVAAETDISPVAS